MAKKKTKTILIASTVVTLVVISLLLFVFTKEKDNRIIASSDNKTQPILDNYVVEVKGEVNRPGIYIVSSEARIADVIELAMGFTPNADKSNINLASKVEDGMQIIVYTYYEKTGEEKNLVNINTASIEALMKLPGIGEVKAKAIINYREKNGWFSDINEIKNVSGISESLFEQIKDLITV